MAYLPFTRMTNEIFQAGDIVVFGFYVRWISGCNQGKLITTP